MKITVSRCSTPIHDGNPKTTIVFGKIYKKNKEKIKMAVFGFKWLLKLFVNMEKILVILFLLLYWSIRILNSTYNDDSAEDIDEDDDEDINDDEDIDDDVNILLYMLYIYMFLSDVDFMNIFQMCSTCLWSEING